MMSDVIRVLYVDDETGLLEIAKHYLEKDGMFTIDILTSAKLALIQLNTERYDAIISDYQMPEMDGITFLKQLKASGNTIPFIIFTGRGREEVVIEALNSGADFYIQKGGDPKSQFAELSNKIQYAVTRKRAEKELLEKNEELSASYEQISAAEEELRGQFEMLVKNETDLRESEERYRLISENTADVIWTLNYKTGKFTYVSPSVQKLRGYTTEEVMTQTLAEALTPESMETVNRLIQEGISKRKPGDTSRQITTNMIDQPCKDGAVVSTEVVSTLVFDELGNPVEIFGISRDITERKKAEAALRESESHLSSIIRVAPIGIGVISNRIIMTVNNRLCQMTGYTAEELIGKSSRLLYPTQEDFDYVGREKYTQIAQKGSGSVETRWQKKDGTIIDILLSSTPINPSNLEDGVTFTALDITERKTAEKFVRESENKFSSVFHGSPVALTLVSALDGRFVDINDAFVRATGYTRDEVIGATSEVLGIFTDGTQRERLASTLKERHIVEDMEIICRTKTGEIRPCLFSSAIILIDRKPHILSTVRDITERKKAEAALLHQSETLSILNGIISTANKADNLPQLLSSILEESLHLLDFDVGGIYLVDRSTRTANVVHSKNLPEEFLAEIQPLPIDKKPYDKLFIKNEPVITENYAEIAPDRSKKYGFLSMASIPLLSKGVAIGALNVASKRRQVISEEEKQTLISISRELGSTIERMAAEEEVRKSAKNLETLFNSIDDMVFVLDMQGNILAVNDTVQKRLLYSSEELVGTNVLQLHVPERRDEALKIVQGMIAGTIDSCPVPVLAKDSTRIEVETKVTRGWWNGNEALLGVSRDITERKVTEDELRFSERKFAAAFEASPNPIAITDIKTGIILDINRAFEKWSGYSLDEISGKTTNELNLWVYPEERDTFVRQLTTQGSVSKKEVTFRTKNGETRDILFSANVFGTGNKTFMLSLAEDITDRRQAEDALAKSEEMFRTLLERVPSIAVQGYRPDHIVVYWNEANTRMYGYTAEEAIGRDIRDLVVPAPARDEVTKAIARMAETGIPEPSAELELLHKDGSLVPVFSSHAVVKIPGRSTIQFCFDVDLSERKKAEDTIRKNEERFRTIINSMQFGIVIIDAQTHTIVKANPKALELIGSTSESVIGSVCHRFICPAELGKCPVTDLLQTVDSSERILLNLRGERIPILKSVIKTMLGEKEVLIESFINISDRKLAEDTLQRVNQKLNVLSQLTRQDLTTQIFILNSYLEMAKTHATGHDGIVKNIESSERAVRSIKEITEFTKDYQNMGEKPPKYQNVKLSFLFGLSHISIGEIRHSLETENLEIFADPLLEKAFQGLLENSVEHGGHVSLIRVSHTVTPDGVRIIFEDDGVGISAEKKERIFLRGEGARASVRGLFFVREILDITGIIIRESGEPGKGARFEMTVPKGAWRISGKGA